MDIANLNPYYLIAGLVVVSGVFLFWLNKPEKKDGDADTVDKIIIVEEDSEPVKMNLHDAARLIRAEHFGGSEDDTLQRDYVDELDGILTVDALANGEAKYLGWLLEHPQNLAQLTAFVDNANWNLARAILEEDLTDVLDVDNIIMYLKSRDKNEDTDTIS